jgi:co-chaperonin GroES (HSP10)
MIRPGYNKVLVHPETKYIGNITSLLRMSAIQQGSSVDTTDYVNIQGKVISVPMKTTKDGYSAYDILPGDIAIFSYRVIHNFIPGDPEQDPVYRNMVTVQGKEYFTASIEDVFAVIRNDKIRMLNGYVMVVEMEKEPKILLPQALKRKKTATALVSQVQKNGEYYQGDRVFFNPNKIQVYQINGKPFGILRHKDIYGVERVA